MSTNNNQDIHNILAPYCRKQRAFTIRGLIISSVSAIIAGICAWQWWPSTEMSGGKELPVLATGLIVFVVAGCLTSCLIPPYCIADDDLQRLAALDVTSREALDYLQKQLRDQGYLSLNDALHFAGIELKERRRLAGLKESGACALLQKLPPGTVVAMMPVPTTEQD